MTASLDKRSWFPWITQTRASGRSLSAATRSQRLVSSM